METELGLFREGTVIGFYCVTDLQVVINGTEDKTKFVDNSLFKMPIIALQKAYQMRTIY